MVSTPTEIDVLIIAPPGAVGEMAERLRSALVERNLRVKLNLIAMGGGGLLPIECEADAKRARHCVLLASVGKTVQYALMPAPKVRGQEPEFAPAGAVGKSSEVEIGVLAEDVAAFAGRIDARLRG